MGKKPHDRPLQLREAAEARMKVGLVTRIAEGDDHGLRRLVTVQELSGNEIESTMLNEKLHPGEQRGDLANRTSCQVLFAFFEKYSSPCQRCLQHRTEVASV
jgi:hypothetical protein